MKNCMEFILAEQGMYCVGGSTAALYDTFGPAAAQFILGETAAKSVVSTRAQLERLCQAKKSGECPTFQYAILVDGVTPAASKMAAEAGLEVVSFAKVEAVGAQTITQEGHKHSPPSGKDIATFCYTSGMQLDLLFASTLCNYHSFLTHSWFPLCQTGTTGNPKVWNLVTMCCI
jgi:long-chain acyl-CoA synthetase